MSIGITREEYEAEQQEFIDLVEAVRDVYFAAHWTADRLCEEAKLWETLRDAAGIEPGHAPSKRADQK